MTLEAILDVEEQSLPERSPGQAEGAAALGELGDVVPSVAPRREAIPDGSPTPREPSPEGRRTGAPAPAEDRLLERDGRRGEKPRRGRQLKFAIALLLALPVAAGGYLYWDYSAHFESTDDAFVTARQFAIAPKVSGYLTAVPVTDNQHVAAGDVIARIDDRDYRNALSQAEALVANAEAGIRNIDAQLGVQQAQITASQAQVVQAKAGLVFAQQQADRYEALQRTGYGSVQHAQQYSSQLRQQQAALDTAQANLNLAERQVDALRAQRDGAVASLAQAEAQRAQAQLNLSYTTVTADQPGRVVQLSAAVGEFAQPGTNLTMFVPDEIWVVANFKETQLDAMRPGDSATLEIDAYPERTFHGHVDSVQPGSGTAFSLLPAENATGNYVKIVQRVPVKIVLDKPPTDVALGPGMSAVPTVRVDPAPSLIERLRGWV